jgi:hypothetical protein
MYQEKFKVRAELLDGKIYYIHLNGLVAFEKEDGKLGWLTADEFSNLYGGRSVNVSTLGCEPCGAGASPVDHPICLQSIDSDARPW